MLKTIDGAWIKKVPHEKEFRSLEQQLGDIRAREVREDLNRIIDEMEPDAKTGRRTFSSSHLGSKLGPWPRPLSHLYDVAREREGENAPSDHVEKQAGLYFGLFVWECILNREETWTFYDPNLSASDPNREITGKVYFESEDAK